METRKSARAIAEERMWDGRDTEIEKKQGRKSDAEGKNEEKGRQQLRKERQQHAVSSTAYDSPMR
jgi:hypothetical protein